MGTTTEFDRIGPRLSCYLTYVKKYENTFYNIASAKLKI